MLHTVGKVQSCAASEGAAFFRKESSMNRIKLTEKIHKAVENQIRSRGYAAPVDVLIEIGVLTKKNYEDWRFGRVSYLEKVCTGTLSSLSFANQEIRSHAKKLGCHESFTVYMQWGKGKSNTLRFSKSNDPSIERRYATHYVNAERISELKREKEKKHDNES